jgi:hypothetical protein
VVVGAQRTPPEISAGATDVSTVTPHSTALTGSSLRHVVVVVLVT